MVAYLCGLLTHRLAEMHVFVHLIRKPFHQGSVITAPAPSLEKHSKRHPEELFCLATAHYRLLRYLDSSPQTGDQVLSVDEQFLLTGTCPRRSSPSQSACPSLLYLLIYEK